MRTPVLIVGGGPAGLAAATALSSVGCPNVLVEKMDQLGGAPILSRYAKLVPSGEWAEDAIGGMVARVAHNGMTDSHLNTIVQTFEGEAGRFHRDLVGWLRRHGLLGDFSDRLHAFRFDQQA